VSSFCDGKGNMNKEKSLDFTSQTSLNNIKLLYYRTVEKFRQIVLFQIIGNDMNMQLFTHLRNKVVVQAKA
jgi:hypothetical protein